MQPRLVLLAAIIPLALAGCFDSHWAAYAQSQSETRQKPTLKDFGSSLKRFKWDPKKESGGEIKTEYAANNKNGAADDIIRVDTSLVICDVMVLDKQGRAVVGLGQSDFIVSEDGQPQSIAHFSLGNDVSRGRSIVLIIDHSRSQFRYMNTSVAAARTLIDKLGPKDRMAIVTDDVALLIDFTSDGAELKKALESLRKRTRSDQQLGSSKQFSALLATVSELFGEEDVRPIIIFQTDCDEVNFLPPVDPHVFDLPAGLSPNVRKKALEWAKSQITEFSLSDVYAAIEKSRATVYTIISGPRLIGLLPAEQRKRGLELFWNPPELLADQQLRILIDFRVRQQSAGARVATLSGGWTSFLEKPEQASEIYSSILSDVNSRFVIGYYPVSKLRDGKRHQVLVQVRNHPDYLVSGRKAYYAPAP